VGEQGSTTAPGTPPATPAPALARAVPAAPATPTVPVPQRVEHDVVLEVRGLSVSYPSERGRIKAVDRLDLEVRAGEVLGIVGESGSGKTTMATAVLGLVRPPARLDSGEIIFEGRDLRSLPPEQLRQVRWRRLAFISQGAMSALNPVVRVGQQFADAMRAHGMRKRSEVRRRTDELLRAVDLPPATARLYPHELSGGMKQRVCIAMAIALRPSLVVADEPTSALDVVVQRTVMETLRQVQRDNSLSLILIGHDMALQAQVVDRLAVMCKGHLVEVGPVVAVFSSPAHPYTRLLLASVPSIKANSWVPAAPSPQMRDEAYALADGAYRLKEVGPGHQAALA
jgi:peptide/nickel transport system ATP-binding protein